MCTVSYIPVKNSKEFILTSNRDELRYRVTLPPTIYEKNGIKISFPKDTESGGSWIAINNVGRTACLLNGAFIKHNKEPHHTHSRGKILHELVSNNMYILDFFDKQNLTHTEPFTMVTIDQDLETKKLISFSEFIWDGNDKHFRELDFEKPRFWSSATLYNENKRKIRKSWFQKFLEENHNKLNEKKILDFHTGSHTSDNKTNLIMDLDNGLKTVSITQITNEKGLKLKYIDLQTKQEYQTQL